VHEGPTPEKRQALQAQLKALGVAAVLSEQPTPAEMAAIAAAVQGRPDALQIHTLLLRSMQQAIYTASNNGHFGLAYAAYTHFTSPIRRYPDLLVHRVLKAILAGKRYHLAGSTKTRRLEPRRGGKPARSARPLGRDMELWEAAGGHCSANERRADEASRDVEAWLKCRYMRERLGEEFTGTVTGVAGFGLFVTLDALYVEGLVHITELGGEYYRFDEARQELRGERTGIRYAMGARVRVQVSRVDLDGRKIDFRMVRDGDGERLLQRGQGGKPPAERADKVDSAAAELAAVKQADRASRGAAKAAKASQGGGKGVGGHPARARKPGPQRPAPRPRTRR
jgi:ribonuclease R